MIKKASFCCLKWIKQIKSCLESCTIYILLVNESSTKNFVSTKGEFASSIPVF